MSVCTICASRRSARKKAVQGAVAAAMPSLHAPLAHAAGLELIADQLAAVLAAAEEPLQLVSITGPPGIGAPTGRTMIVLGTADIRSPLII